MEYLFVLLVCLVASCDFLNTAEDIYFILATGRYITEHGIFYEDVLTMHEGLIFQAEQWLTSVMYWNIYDNFGFFGLSLIIALFFCLTGVLYYKIYQYYGGKGMFFPVMSLLMLGIFYASSRPQTISMFFSLLFLYSLEMARKSKKWYGVSLLCSTAVANFHGGVWFTLLLIIGAFAVQFYKDWKEYAVLILGVFLFGALNPYGFGMLGFAGGTLAESYHAMMAEEMCPAALVVKGVILQDGLFVIFSIFLLGLTYKRLELRHILLFFGFWLMSMVAVRGFLQLLLLGFPAVLVHIDKKWDNYIFVLPIIIGKLFTSGFFWVSNYNLFYLLISIILLWKLRKSVYKFSCIVLFITMFFVRPYGFASNNYIEKTDLVNAMTTYPGGTVYTVHGSFFEFFGYKPYIDMRLELFSKAKNKKKNIIWEYLAVRDGKYYFPDFVDKYKFDYIITNEGELEYTYMRDVKGYKKINEKDKLKLYERLP